MSRQAENGSPFDPFGVFREMRDANLESWSKAMIDLVNSEAYARATGAALDGYLTSSIPFQRALAAAMVQAQEQLHMPTREDVTRLAERLTHIELRLDDMDAKLDALSRTLSKPTA
ncbi:MAG: hypothetical protein H7Y32_02980 [Chloroflexales bacterium]|nr:hypothetical protein [Chloroflexales bacterium]